MAGGVELNNLRAQSRDGVLYIMDTNGNTIMSIAPSTGLLRYQGNTATTVATDTTLTRVGHMGKTIGCLTDGVFFTLPVASTTSLPGAQFTVVNTGSDGAAQIILITATGDSIIGCGVTTSNLISNTKATAKKGDSATVIATGSSTWYLIGLTGTWASTT